MYYALQSIIHDQQEAIRLAQWDHVTTTDQINFIGGIGGDLRAASGGLRPLVVGHSSPTTSVLYQPPADDQRTTVTTISPSVTCFNARISHRMCH
jgi:hypothetical protein